MQEIIDTLDAIALNGNNEPLYVLGGYIVGATLVREDSRSLFQQYPLLETISELGADLEMLEDDTDAASVFEDFKQTLTQLKNESL